jgi:hypothetical protein
MDLTHKAVQMPQVPAYTQFIVAQFEYTQHPLQETAVQIHSSRTPYESPKKMMAGSLWWEKTEG